MGPVSAFLRPRPAAHVLEVALCWQDTVLQLRRLPAGQDVCVGSSPACAVHFPIQGWGTDPFPLVDRRGLGLVRVPPGMQPRLRSGATVLQADTLEARRLHGMGPDGLCCVQLRLGETLELHQGDAWVRLRWVPRGPALRSSGPAVDGDFLNALVGTLAVAALLFGMLRMAPRDTEQEEDLFRGAKGFITSAVQPHPRPVKPPPPPVKTAQSNPPPRPVHRPRVDTPRAAPRVDAQARAAAREAVRAAGVLGMLRKPGGALGRVFDGGGLGAGFNETLNGLTSVSVADNGAGGMGTRGVGPGGGDGNVVGLGALGGGGGPRGGGGPDLDSVGSGHRGGGPPAGRTVVAGGLEREEIARVMGRYLSQVRHCYESELNRSPNLAGKVVTSFIITGTGRVVDAAVVETSLEDAGVEACVLKVLGRMQFPAPKGGGIVVVTHPYLFQSAGR